MMRFSSASARSASRVSTSCHAMACLKHGNQRAGGAFVIGAVGGTSATAALTADAASALDHRTIASARAGVRDARKCAKASSR
jgi:hypothetical protein